MNATDTTAAEFLETVPAEKRAALAALRELVVRHLPQGFEEVVHSGMLNYVVPHSVYPAGYHCNPKQPLPFIALTAKKTGLSFHHIGLYVSPELTQWLQQAWPAHSTKKLDMGKGCIRFKKEEDIPRSLMAELVQKLTVQQWIDLYEKVIKK